MDGDSVLHILLIDDDEDDYVWTRSMLSASEGKKYILDWIASYEEGKAALQQTVYDAVLVDYDLKGRTGLDLIREAVDRKYPSPLILFTGLGSYDVDLEAMQSGATLYLSKSEANPLLLERYLRYAIERKQTELALAEANEQLTRQKQELEQKNAQLQETLAALQASDDRFRSLFYKITEGFALHEIILDDQGKPCDYRFLEINPSFERLTGLKREDVIDRLKTEVLPGDDAYWIEIYGQVALSGQPVHFESYSSALKQHYEVFAYCPAPLQFAVLFMNITERKRMEEAMSVSLSKYKVLFESFPLGITVSDVNGRIIETNDEASRLLGLPKDEHVQRLIDGEEWKIIRPDGSLMPPEEYASVRALKEEQRIANVEMGILKPGGEVTWITVTATPIDLDGYGVVVTYADITERKWAETALQEKSSQLERMNDELQSFAYIASHDLQEPLRKISRFSKLLEGQAAEKLSEEEKDYLDRMRSAAERMQTMIDSLLAYSRVATHPQPLTLVDLNQTLQEVLSDLEARIEASQGKVEVDQLPQVEADPFQMHQLFLNLLGNALKFTRANTPPRATVTARRLGDPESSNARVQIVVQDEGIGFAPEHRERLFQPFQRLHGRSEYEGTGIGLAICRKIVERHRGSLTAMSKKGEGSTFIVTLPVHQ